MFILNSLGVWVGLKKLPIGVTYVTDCSFNQCWNRKECWMIAVDILGNCFKLQVIYTFLLPGEKYNCKW